MTLHRPIIVNCYLLLFTPTIIRIYLNELIHKNLKPINYDDKYRQNCNKIADLGLIKQTNKKCTG